jgi:hypothetical protein
LIFPEDYKYVGAASEARPGDPIYFSTRYLIHFGGEITIYRVEARAGVGFMRPVRSMEPIASGDTILVYPETVDTRNRAMLIELASSLCKGRVNTVIFRGPDEHITFVHDPDPAAVTEIEILDVVPPRPSWLVSVVGRLVEAGVLGDLTLKFRERVLDLRRFEGDDVYFPCTASGLGRSLDRDRVEVDDPLIVGCEVSREVFRDMYPGKNFRFLNTCPLSNDELAPKGPFITRCCKSERSGISWSRGQLGVVVHWGDGAPKIAEAIRCLAEELKRG